MEYTAVCGGMFRECLEELKYGSAVLPVISYTTSSSSSGSTSSSDCSRSTAVVVLQDSGCQQSRPHAALEGERPGEVGHQQAAVGAARPVRDEMAGQLLTLVQLCLTATASSSNGSSNAAR